MNVAVADEGGHPLAFARMDNAWMGSIKIAINKVYTARAFDLSTAKLAKPGEPLYGIQQSNHGRIMIFAGGKPLLREGRIVGSIVSVAATTLKIKPSPKPGWKPLPYWQSPAAGSPETHLRSRAGPLLGSAQDG